MSTKISTLINTESSPGDTLRYLLRKLLESGEVDSVFALRKTMQKGRYCYSLITEPSRVDEILPFHPVMPVQGARALSQLTITEPFGRPVTALLKPCEIRAFVEIDMMKHAGHREGIHQVTFFSLWDETGIRQYVF